MHENGQTRELALHGSIGYRERLAQDSRTTAAALRLRRSSRSTTAPPPARRDRDGNWPTPVPATLPRPRRPRPARRPSWTPPGCARTPTAFATPPLHRPPRPLRHRRRLRPRAAAAALVVLLPPRSPPWARSTTYVRLLVLPSSRLDDQLALPCVWAYI
jgi:hypothetical protein